MGNPPSVHSSFYYDNSDRLFKLGYMPHIETGDIDWVKKNLGKGYRSDPLKFYPTAQGRCPVCGKKWVVVKGKLKQNCECGIKRLRR